MQYKSYKSQVVIISFSGLSLTWQKAVKKLKAGFLVRLYHTSSPSFLPPSSFLPPPPPRHHSCKRQIAVGFTGPQPQAPDRNGHCQTPTASARSRYALPDLNQQLLIAVGTAGPQPPAPDCSGHYGTSTASARSQWALPDLNTPPIQYTTHVQQNTTTIHKTQPQP